MIQSYDVLQKTVLFANMAPDEIDDIFACLSPQIKKIDKGSFVFRAGDEVCSVYLLLTGHMHIVDEDYWGNRSIVETLPPHTFFGEAYVLTRSKKHLVSVLAGEDSTILVVNAERLLNACTGRCHAHMTLMHNMSCILSAKIVRLTEKLGHMVRKTTREKVLSYLSKCAQNAQSNCFSIPYSRQQLADYLAVDRSALSSELSKMEDQGLLRYHRNSFELLQ